MDNQLKEDCDIMRKSLSKKGDELIQFVLSKNKSQRQDIRAGYKVCWGIDLLTDIDKHLSGNYKHLMIALFQRPAEFDAECLYKAMKGMGTDEDTLIEIICTRSNESLKRIKEEFSKNYPQYSLEQWVSSETSGSFKKILISLLQCLRKENTDYDENECAQIAKDLYEGGEKRLGTDEALFNKIFAVSSPAELFCINQKYSEISTNTLKRAIEKEYSRDCKKALLTILDGILNPAEYFARRVNLAVKGLGTNDKMLIRVLVSREGVDMEEMKKIYKNIFQKDMAEDVRSDTSGDYRKLLLGIVNESFC